MKKVYLETPEAVIKALKDGKEIKNEDEYNKYSYKLVDGFIVNTVGNNFIVGGDISNIDNHPYILEEEPLKIEVDKFYKTRDGRKAFVYAKICFDYAYPFCVVRAEKLDSYNVNENGKQASNDQSLNLVAPWENDN